MYNGKAISNNYIHHLAKKKKEANTVGGYEKHGVEPAMLETTAGINRNRERYTEDNEC